MTDDVLVDAVALREQVRDKDVQQLLSDRFSG